MKMSNTKEDNLVTKVRNSIPAIELIMNMHYDNPTVITTLIGHMTLLRAVLKELENDKRNTD